ncbi:MAG: C39 family peptidase [Anaerolineae bacterium]
MSKEIPSFSRLVMLLVVALAIALGSFPVDLAAGDTSDPYYSVETIPLSDGTQLERITISGPPTPPPGYELQRTPVTPSELHQLLGIYTLPVPAYDWVFGCSAVSASMIGAYFDRTTLPDIYTGPTNDGVMPMDNSIWGTWTDGLYTYRDNPLTASHNGLDGRTTNGSIDDYWVQYGSNTRDPYITGGWAQHAWGDAIGDYMKTSQSAYDNTDGSTVFYNYSSASKLTCAIMETMRSGRWFVYERDGTYGRKLFYEARGYSVVDCYNQKTDNIVAGGFSFADYKAKIDAGYPVFLNLAGHSVVGIGYDDSTTPGTVYLNDTWDYNTHTMVWGGSYADMALQSVSIADPDIPTAVDLARFESWPEWPRVHVQWETTNEVDNLGFNLYRAEAGNEGDTRIQLNKDLIPTSMPPGSPSGAIYDWIDKYKLRKNRIYLYWLEDVDIYGRRTMHGPVQVTISK